MIWLWHPHVQEVNASCNTLLKSSAKPRIRGMCMTTRLLFWVVQTSLPLALQSESTAHWGNPPSKTPVKLSPHHPSDLRPWHLQSNFWTKVSVTIPESGGLGVAKSLRILRLLRVYRSIKGVKALGGRDWTGHSKANKTVAAVAVPAALTILQVCGS